MSNISSMPRVTRMKTTPKPSSVRTQTVQLGSGDAKRSISGDTFRIPFSKRAKKKKSSEPLCDCGMPISKCQCDGHDHAKKSGGKNITKAKVRMPTPQYSTRYREVVNREAVNRNIRNNPNPVSEYDVPLPPVSEYDVQLPPTWGWTNDVSGSWRNTGVPQTSAQDALLGTLLDSTPRDVKSKPKQKQKQKNTSTPGMYTRAKNAIKTPVQNATNAVLDATLKDIVMLPVTTTRYVGRGIREIPQKVQNAARKTRNAMIAGKIYGKQYLSELTAGKKPDKVALGIAGNPKANTFGRRMQNISMAAKLYGKDYVSDLGKTTVRDILNSARKMSTRKKALALGLTAGGLYAANELMNKRQSFKKSITPMGRHVVGGYRGKIISKAIRSSQANTSNKYL
jgi:hypothetical protein